MEEWRRRREEMSLGRERPEERTTRPPCGSSRSSPIICSWNWTMLLRRRFGGNLVVAVCFVAGRFDLGMERRNRLILVCCFSGLKLKSRRKRRRLVQVNLKKSKTPSHFELRKLLYPLLGLKKFVYICLFNK